MSALWPALIGAGSALFGVWVTQWLTNRREFQRDQLRWAQERQQRELDAHKTAFTEALLALNRWHAHALAMVMHLDSDTWRRPDQDDLPDLEAAAANGLVAVELTCSEKAIHATQIAHSTVMNISFTVGLAAKTPEYGQRDEFGLQSSVRERLHEASEAMKELRRMYKAELARLATGPVALPQKPRKSLRLPWRKSV